MTSTDIAGRTSTPRVLPGASLVAVLVRLLLVGLAVVAIHDLAVSQGWASGSSWVGTVVDGVAGLEAAWWTTALGVVVALVGLWLLWVSVRPARASHERVGRDLGTEVYVSDGALRGMAQGAARWAPGVEDASVSVTRRRVQVDVTAVDDASVGRARREVERQLEGWTDRGVKVRGTTTDTTRTASTTPSTTTSRKEADR